MAQLSYAGTGRRKDSVARVRLVPGKGNVTINKRDAKDRSEERRVGKECRTRWGADH